LKLGEKKSEEFFMDIIEIQFGKGLMEIQRGMERMIDDFFGRSRPFVGTEGRRLVPATDVYETSQGIIVISEISGVNREDIRVNLDGSLLSLSGIRKNPVSEPKTRIHQMELEFGRFERLIRIPISIDPDGIQATYKDGIVKIFLPKKRIARRVTVVTRS
jgi:HSP20 family protein